MCKHHSQRTILDSHARETSNTFTAHATKHAHAKTQIQRDHSANAPRHSTFPKQSTLSHTIEYRLYGELVLLPISEVLLCFVLIGPGKPQDSLLFLSETLAPHKPLSIIALSFERLLSNIQLMMIYCFQSAVAHNHRFV